MVPAVPIPGITSTGSSNVLPFYPWYGDCTYSLTKSVTGEEVNDHEFH